jgi:hypothetical protein
MLITTPLSTDVYTATANHQQCHVCCLCTACVVADGEGSEAMSRSKKYRLRMNARVKADPPPPPSAKTLFVPNLRNRTTEEEFVAFVRWVF